MDLATLQIEAKQIGVHQVIQDLTNLEAIAQQLANTADNLTKKLGYTSGLARAIRSLGSASNSAVNSVKKLSTALSGINFAAITQQHQNLNNTIQAGINHTRTATNQTKQLAQSQVTAASALQHHSKNWIQHATSVAGGIVLYQAIREAMRLVVGVFTEGVRVADEFQTKTITIASVLTTLAKDQSNIPETYRQSKLYAESLIPVLMGIDAHTTGNLESLMRMTEEMAKQGVTIRTNSAEDIEGMTRLANAVLMVSRNGQDVRQVQQEIRALMQGQHRDSDQLGKLLYSIYGEKLKPMLQNWKQQGIAVAEIGKALTGFGPGAKDMEGTWHAVRTSLETTMLILGKDVFTPILADWSIGLQSINKYLKEHKEEIQGAIRDGWMKFKDVLVSVKENIGFVKLALEALVATSIISGLTNIAAGFFSIVQGLEMAAAGMTAFMASMGSAATISTGGIFAIFVGIAAAIALIIENWDKVTAAYNNFVSAVQSSPVFQQISVEAGHLVSIFGSLWQSAGYVWNIFKEITGLNAVWKAFGEIISNIGQTFSNVWTFVLEQVNRLLGWLDDKLKGITKSLHDMDKTTLKAESDARKNADQGNIIDETQRIKSGYFKNNSMFLPQAPELNPPKSKIGGSGGGHHETQAQMYEKMYRETERILNTQFLLSDEYDVQNKMLEYKNKMLDKGYKMTVGEESVLKSNLEKIEANKRASAEYKKIFEEIKGADLNWQAQSKALTLLLSNNKITVDEYTKSYNKLRLEYQKSKDPLYDMVKGLRDERELMGLNNEALALATTLLQAKNKLIADGIVPGTEQYNLAMKQLEAEKRLNIERQKQLDSDFWYQFETQARSFVENYTDTLNEMVWNSKLSFKIILQDFMKMVTKIIIETQIVKPLVNGMFGGGGSSTSSAIIGGISGAVGGAVFANGGIMTKFGSMELKKYANGGVATSPQFAVFGEGSNNEAFVPLPDGRSIPAIVDMKNFAMPDIQINIENNSGTKIKKSQVTRREGKAIIVNAVVEAIDSNDNGITDLIRKVGTGSR